MMRAVKSGAPPTALHPGDRLDRYELLCPLAQGGMAAVWLARLHGKHGFQKLFAVKFILPQYAEDVRFQRMFLDEARIASGISHPFVANILDLGEERGILYIVMDWIDGDSLSRLISSVARTKQRIPANIAVRIAADVAGALHAAHELHDSEGRALGVVHRDVSPSNVILTTKGSPKVIDFGIAKAVVRLTQETGAGLMKGKVMYMAPEQAMGKSVDRRADVWAVAAVLHTLLAGHPPFTGDNEMAMLHRLTSGSIPNALPLTVPPSVRGILKAAMRFDRTERMATCALLQEALETALQENGTPTTAADVAAYSAKFLEDSATQRQEMVRSALEQASVRTSSPPRASGSLTPPPRHSLPAAMSAPSISGPSLTTAPTSGPSTSEGSRRGAALFAVGAVAAGVLAVGSWALLRSHAGRVSAASSTALTQASAALSAPASAPATGTLEAPVAPPAALAPGAAGTAVRAAAVAVPAATPARTHATADAPPAFAAPAAPPVTSEPGVAPTPAPLAVAPLSIPVPAPPPAPPPQAIFAPESGRVTVGKVDVDRVSARSVNGLLRHVGFDRCYIAGLRARGSAVAGTAVLVLDIDQNEVSRAHLDGDLGLPGLRSCIESQLSMQHVDDADTGMAAAHVTLSFSTAQ
jgi:serine/threonine protein kinase